MEVRVDPGNQQQADAWNGDEGQGWVAEADRYEASAAAYIPHVLAAARITTTDQVLDVGCGMGGSTSAAAQAAPEGHATGLDLSRPMIDEARRRAAARGVANVSFEQADAQVHSFARGGADVVISKFGAMFFADPVAAFTNLAGALRDDGRLAVVAWCSLDDNEWIGALRTALAAGRDLPLPPAGVPGPFGLADADRTRAVLTEAGFVDVTIDAQREPFVVGSTVDDAFAFASTSGIARGLLADLDDAARADALARLRATLEEHLSPAGVTLPSSAWSISARRG